MLPSYRNQWQTVNYPRLPQYYFVILLSGGNINKKIHEKKKQTKPSNISCLTTLRAINLTGAILNPLRHKGNTKK